MPSFQQEQSCQYESITTRPSRRTTNSQPINMTQAFTISRDYTPPAPVQQDTEAMTPALIQQNNLYADIGHCESGRSLLPKLKIAGRGGAHALHDKILA